MTYVDEVEVRRASVGTRVLAFACGIFAVLGSFWAIVWFIRTYVEAPRVNIPAPMALAASESRPAPAPEGRVIPKVEAAEAPPAAPIVEAQTKPPPVVAAPAARNSATSRETEPSASGAVADRWFPMNQLPTPAAPPPAPAPTVQAEPPPAAPEPAAAAGAVDAEPPIEEVAEGSVPAIAGRAPLPRPKPTMTASRRVEATPLPRPRPDGPAPQSVWTGVPATDERFNAQ